MNEVLVVHEMVSLPKDMDGKLIQLGDVVFKKEMWR